jgi:hypothetical protein
MQTTPNMLMSFSIKLLVLVIDLVTFIAHVWIVGLKTSNIVIKKRIVALTSYSTSKQIQAPHPT